MVYAQLINEFYFSGGTDYAKVQKYVEGEKLWLDITLMTQFVQAIILGFAVYRIRKSISPMKHKFDYCTFVFHFFLFIFYCGLLWSVRQWNAQSAKGLEA